VPAKDRSKVIAAATAGGSKPPSVRNLKQAVTDFDTAELDAMEPIPKRAAQNGAPSLSVKHRKEIQLHFGRFVRALESAGLLEQHAMGITAIAEVVEKL
jgi:hypothetical protein